MGAHAYSYDYDPIGNRMQSAVAVGSGQPSTTNTYAANALNQYTAITNCAFSASPYETIPAYDLDGNMLTNGVWAYTWDAENRLVSAYNGEVGVRNTYDHQSRRIRKESFVFDTGTLAYVLQSDRVFVYDGWNPVSEFSWSPAAQQWQTCFYTWGLDLSGTQQGAGGVGGLLAVTAYTEDAVSGQTGATYYPTYDANGNVTAYLDTTGETAASFEYDAFGKMISENVGAGLHLPFRFSTKYLDPETGLYYYGYRFYHPELGRWVSRDPIEERGGLNLFGAVGNSMASNFDLFGLSSSFTPKVSCKDCSFEEIERVSGTYLKLANQKTIASGLIIWNGYTLWKEWGARICCDPIRKEVFSPGLVEGKIDIEYNPPRQYVAFSADPNACSKARDKAYEVAIIHSHPPNSPALSTSDMSNNWIYMVTQVDGVLRFFRSRRGMTDGGRGAIEKCERIKGEWLCEIIPLK